MRSSKDQNSNYLLSIIKFLIRSVFTIEFCTNNFIKRIEEHCSILRRNIIRITSMSWFATKSMFNNDVPIMVWDTFTILYRAIWNRLSKIHINVVESYANELIIKLEFSYVAQTVCIHIVEPQKIVNLFYMHLL